VHLVPAAAGAPCFDADLKAALSGASELAAAPPGSAELLPALRASGALGRLARGGTRHVEVNAVDDNVLWRPADPLLIGYAASTGAMAAAKVVEPASVRAAYAAAAAAAAPTPRVSAGGGASGGGAGAGSGGVWDGVARQAPGIGVYYFSTRALEKLAAAYEREPLAGARLAPAAGVPKLPPGPPPAPAPLPSYLPPAARARALAAAAAAAEAAAAPRPVDGYALARSLGEALRAGEVLPPGAAALLGVARAEEFATVWPRGPHWLAVPAAAAAAPRGKGGALPAAPVPAPVAALPSAAAARLLALTTAWVRAAGGAVARGCGGVEVSPLASYAGEGLEPLCRGAAFADARPKALAGSRRPAGAARHNAGGWGAPLALAYVGALALAAAQARAGRPK
jgi:hypothetical protein